MASSNASFTMNGEPTTLSAISTTFTLFKLASDATKPVQVFMPGGGRLDGVRFRVKASGYVTGATTTNATITLQYGTSATTGSNTTIEASTASAVNSTTRPWFIEADCITDSVVKTLIGAGKSMVGNTLDALAALDNAPTSVDPASEGQGFVVGCTFSSGDTSNTCTLKDFSLEVL